MNGRSVFIAVYNADGMERGNVERNGTSTEGAEVWSELKKPLI